MAIPTYLAMTAGEFHHFPFCGHPAAWMACHFSPYGTGLSNLPVSLPENSLLILNDRIPFCGHDPQRIADQLRHAVQDHGCTGILLDFQREVSQDVLQLCQHLTNAVSCPVIISDSYGKDLDCPVFLSPCPHHVPLKDYIEPWHHRQIWLDLAMDAEEICITAQGSSVIPLPADAVIGDGFEHQGLHCHYHTAVTPDCITFTLHRTRSDLDALAYEAESLGIYALAGLYQELY